MNSVLERTDRIKEERSRETLLQLLAGLAFIAIFAAIIAVSYMLDKRAKTVVSAEDVGTLRSATYSTPSVQETSTITTDNGTFLVMGILQVVTGHKAELQVMGNDTRRLCDTTANICKTLKE